MFASQSENSSVKAGLWLLLLTAASILTTFALACATPFAALGALAALHMKRGEAALLMAVAWLGSQTIGFGFLHYPQTPGTFAWAGALLVAALACAEGASFVARRMAGLSFGLRSLGALAGAMIVFKTVSYIFGIKLGGNALAFQSSALVNFAWKNAAAFVILLVLYRICVAAGLLVAPAGRAQLTA